MGSKRRNNPFWLLTTSNQTRSSCMYLENKTNKNPAGLQAAGARDCISPGRRRVAKDRKASLSQVPPTLTLAGHLPASRIYGHGTLANTGQNFNPVQFT